MFQAHGRVGGNVDKNPFQNAHLFDGKVNSPFVSSTVTSVTDPHLDLITRKSSGFRELLNALSLFQGRHWKRKEEQLQSFSLLGGINEFRQSFGNPLHFFEWITRRRRKKKKG